MADVTAREQACFLLGVLVTALAWWLRSLVDRRHRRMLREMELMTKGIETETEAYRRWADTMEKLKRGKGL